MCCKEALLTSFIIRSCSTTQSIFLLSKNILKPLEHVFSKAECGKYVNALRSPNLLSSTLLSKNLKIKIYRTITLPVVLCGCEIWSLTLREERKLRVFENKVLRRIFGPRRDEVTGEMEEIA